MLHIIVNPGGASGRTMDYFKKQVLPHFKNTQAIVHFSSSDRGIDRIVGELTDPYARSSRSEDGFVNLVIVGGDGSMNQALNGIRDFEHTRIGMIPAGSGNDLLRDMEIPQSLEELVERICKEETYRVCDIGETILHDRGMRRYFNVSSGVGFDAQCCRMAETSPVKDYLNRFGIGKLSYLAQAIRLIFTWKSKPVRMVFSEGNKDTQHTVLRSVDRFVFLAAMNHRFEGGGFMMCPDAKADDGMLDYLVVHDLKIPDFFRFFPETLSGGHIRRKHLVFQARRRGVRVKSQHQMWVHCDGESEWTSGDVEMRISSKKLNMLM